MKATIKERVDGWMNLLTGLGVANKDKRVSQIIQWARMDEGTADSLYASDDLMARIIDQLPNDAMREGYDLDDDALEEVFETFEVDKHFKEAWVKARQYGGAAIFYVTNATELDKPMSASEQIRGMRVLSRWELTPAGSSVDTDLLSPNFGLPKLYQFNTALGSVQSITTDIHHTRLTRFDGARLPRRLFVANNYWHDSEMTRLYNAVRNYQLAHDSAANIVADFNVGVWKIKNLAALVGAGKEAQIRDRVSLAQYSKSVVKAVLLDADGESYEDKARNVTGLPEVLDKIGGRLVAATSLPHTILLGESPNASNGTGNSSTMSWYDHVSAEQQSYATPLLHDVARKLGAKTRPTVTWRPLWQMDEKEQAATRKTQAETDQIYYTIGAIDSAEIRVSRFGNGEGGYSTETKLLGLKPQPKPEPVEPAAAEPVVKADGMTVKMKRLIMSLKLMKTDFKTLDEAKAWIKDHQFSDAEMKEHDDGFEFVQRDAAGFVPESMQGIPLKQGVQAVVGDYKESDLTDPDDEDDGDDKNATGGEADDE